MKKFHVFLIFLPKKTKNWVSELRPDFWKRLVLGKYWNYWRPLWESIVIKCTNLFPNFQRGTSTQKDKKSFQCLKKKDPKILHFWISWNIWLCYGQTLQAICLKFCMQVPLCKGHIWAKFQLINQTFNFFINTNFIFFLLNFELFLFFWVSVPLWICGNRLEHLMATDSPSGHH